MNAQLNPTADRREFVRFDNRSLAANSESYLPETKINEEPARFGVGYGSSSGYVSRRRYSQDWGPARFSVR